jgi:hypothetical protein
MTLHRSGMHRTLVHRAQDGRRWDQAIARSANAGVQEGQVNEYFAETTVSHSRNGTIASSSGRIQSIQSLSALNATSSGLYQLEVCPERRGDREPAGAYLVPVVHRDGARWIRESELVRFERARASGTPSLCRAEPVGARRTLDPPLELFCYFRLRPPPSVFAQPGSHSASRSANLGRAK